MSDILTSTDQKIAANIQYRLDAVVETNRITNERLSAVLAALERAMLAIASLETEMARPRHREVIYDAKGNVTGSDET